MNDFDFDHARRVAARVYTSDAKIVALLHDSFEDGVISRADLEETISGDLLRALYLVSRPKGVSYMDYIQDIYMADGYAGHLARSVKIADLTENLSRMDDEHESLRPRYEAALDLLKRRPSVIPKVVA